MSILRAKATRRTVLGTFRMLLAVCVLLTEKYTRGNLGDSWAANFYLSRYLRLLRVRITVHSDHPIASTAETRSALPTAAILGKVFAPSAICGKLDFSAPLMGITLPNFR